MKFHCDRCKTRYSIADERVRGKILKIRCKNCSAVITVREGGQATVPRTPDRATGGVRTTGAVPVVSRAGLSGPASAGRRAATTGGAARQAASSRPARRASTGGGSALSGAFEHEIRRKRDAVPNPADSVASAPAVLEAEWYVSEDGEQFGPFGLAQARQWVQTRGPDSELYCWSEGFDDWLPIDKVSHFRGLRTAPQVAPHAGAAGGGLYADGDDRTVVDAPPDVPEAAAAAAALPRPTRDKTPVPLFAATLAQVTADAPTEIDEDGVGRGAPSIPGQPLDWARGPNQAPRTNGSSHAQAAAAAPALGGRNRASATHPLTSPPAEPGVDLDIGEASRVVNLSMLSRTPGVATPTAANVSEASGLPGVAGDGQGVLGKGTGSFGRVGALAAAMPIIQGGGTIDMPRPELLQPRSRTSGMLLPIAIAGVVLVGVLSILLYVALGSGDEDEARHLARGNAGGESLAYQFPQEQGGHGKPGKQAAGDSQAGGNKAGDHSGSGRRGNSIARHTTGGHTGGGTVLHPSGGGLDEVDLSHDNDGSRRELSPDDLIEAYNVNKIGVTMCYNSALKHNPLLKVQKAYVRITVGTSGAVTSVSIPTLSGTELGTCLQRRIRAWRFPRSSSGLSSRFPIVFDT